MVLRMMAILVLAVLPGVTRADPAPIRTNFDAGYDVTPYRMGLVMARHRAAVFDLGGAIEPLISPVYGRTVAVDDLLHNALKRSLSTVLNATDGARFSDVQMLTNAAETLIAACGQVNTGAGDAPFLVLFTNPNADRNIQSVGFSAARWIDRACFQMGLK